jgi:MOSC domain-containing protein
LTAHADGDARVTALSIAPVKGLRVASVQRIALGPGGAHGDRRFYLVEERGWMVNGKHSGVLQTVVAELGEDDRLTLRFPDASEVSAAVELGETLPTRFHSLPRTARLVRGPFSAALSEHAGERLRLVEAVDRSSAIDRGPGGGVSMISRGSLAALAQAAGQPSVDARRFRMTVELGGVEPFAEDAWLGREIVLGDAGVLLHGHVGRCIVTSRNPLSGIVDLPTLDLLRSFRSDLETTEPLPFGVYGEVVRPGALRVGDRIELR